MIADRVPANHDVAAILGLRSRAGAVIAGAALAAFLLLGFTSGGVLQSAVYLLGFAILGFGWLLILRAPGDPMRVLAAVATTVSGALAGGLAVIAGDLDDRAVLLALGAAPAVTYALLAVRGRIGIAWIGGVLGAAMIVGATLLRDADISAVAVVMVPGTFGVLTMATFFALLIRPRAQQIAGLRRRERRDSEADGTRLVRDTRVARLHSQVRPLLEHIASGERLSDEQVDTCRLVEAGLRDRIRAPGLDVAEVADAAWEARARGVRVLLLDDREGPLCDGDSAPLAAMRAAAVDALTAACAGAQVTVRLMPEGRDAIGTIATAHDGQVRRIEFA